MKSNLKSCLRDAYLSFSAVCAGAVLLGSASAQADNLFEGNVPGDDIGEFTPGGTESTFAVGFTTLQGLAFNKAGDLFVSYGNSSSGTVTKITPAGVQSTVASGLDYPEGLAFDSAGDLFEADEFSGNVYEFATNGTHRAYAFASDPVGLAFDSAGYLYVASAGDGTIVKASPIAGQSPFVSGLNGPQGLAFDSMGNLFVSCVGDHTIYKITPDGTKSLYASGLDYPGGLAFDSAGNLYVADGFSGKIYEFTPGGAKSTFASGLYYPVALAFQPVPELLAVGTNGICQLTVLMPSPYYSTIIQASINSVDWINIYTNIPPFTFTDPMATNFPHRFYRAMLGP